MRKLSLCLSAVFAPVSLGAPSVEYVEPGYLVSSLSYDGTAAAGNSVGDYSYETFRWTRAGGVERLGLATFPVISRAAGTPNISYSGNQVSASILSSDYQLTQGLWDLNSGWTECMPPVAPGGALVDDGYGSAWGLSGNGQVVTGFFWSENYRAQASAWSATTGIVALGQQEGRSARANAASYDGSVVCGWEENEFGSWMPHVWRGGVNITLDERDGGVNEGQYVSGDGSLVTGSTWNEDELINVATIWRWNGAGYDTEQVGALWGTPAYEGSAALLGISNDGSMAAGVNNYSWGNGEAIVWTPAHGLQTLPDFLAGYSIELDPIFFALDCSAVSADGSTLAVTCLNQETFEYVTAIVRLREPCPADLNGDGVVDDSDFVMFADQYAYLDCADPAMPGYCRADLNGDGIVDDSDFVLFAQAYEQLVCP